MNMQLKSGVQCIEQYDGWLVIDTKGDAPTLKLAPVLRSELEYLQLATANRGQMPAGVSDLVQQLGRYGLVDQTELQPQIKQKCQQGSWRLPNPDRLAAVLAAGLHRVPAEMRAIVWYGVPFFSLLLMSLFIQQSVTAIASIISWPSLWLLAWLPLGWSCHELCHAIACRFYGIPVSGMGVRWAGRLFPTPFISTKALPAQPSPLARSRIALVGPWCDLTLACGFATLALLQPAQSVWLWLAALQLSQSITNLSPFRDSDGLQALRQRLTDALGRQDSRYPLLRRRFRQAYALVLLLPPLLLASYFLTGV
jgi:hypothetical protein